jgi:hypothetical protein
MDPFIVRQLALGVIPPLVVSLVVFAVLWRRSNARLGIDLPDVPTRERPGAAVWVTPLFLGLLSIVMHGVLFGGYNLPPKAGLDWMPLVALVGTVLGVLSLGVKLPAIGRWVLRLGLVGGAGVALTWNFLGRWDAAESVAWIGGFTLATLLTWWGAERAADAKRGMSMPLAMSIWLGASAQIMVMGLSGLATSQAAGVLATAMIALAVVAFFRPFATLAFGGVHVPVVVGMSLLLVAVLPKATPRALEEPDALWTLLLYAGSVVVAWPLSMLADVIGPSRWRGSWKHSALRLGLLLLPLLAALGVAAARFTPPGSEDDYGLMRMDVARESVMLAKAGRVQR